MKKPFPWATILDRGWILTVTLAGSLLLYSGWREMSPYNSPDILAYYGNVIDLVRQGIIPHRGQGLSFSGWGSPGTSLLMVPGVLLMSDPRLVEVPGAVFLHFGTLLLLFLIVRDWFGRGPAWAAVALAGFLPIVGPALWTNGHPFFVVGMLYCLLCWARDRSPFWFSAALLLAGLGIVMAFLALVRLPRALTEIERSWRVNWLWPLKAIAIVVTVESLIRWWKSPRAVSAGMILLAMVLFFPYRLDAPRADAMLRDGFGGRESGQVRAMEWTAGQSGRDPGRLFVISVPRYNGVIDSARVWGRLEFGLKSVFETPNAAVSDVNPADDFRILEFTGADRDQHPQNCPWDGYGLVWKSRRFAICRSRS